MSHWHTWRFCNVLCHSSPTPPALGLLRRDAEQHPPIPLTSRVVLAMFTACAVLDQRLMVLLSKRYTLNTNALTTPTFNTVLTGVAGFIAIVLKGTQHFGESCMIPSALGEWINETLHSLLRDPNCQSTSNVSAHQLMERLGKNLEELQFKKGEHWNPVTSSSSQEQHARHPASHPSYSKHPSEQDVHNAMCLGQALWRQVS